MLVKGYSFSEVYQNGDHNMKENALKYDGDKLEILTNNNGMLHYETISNDDLLRSIGENKKSLFNRLEDDFKVHTHHKSKRHHKTKRHHKSRIHHKTKRHKRSKYRHLNTPRSAKKYFHKHLHTKTCSTRKNKSY